MDWLYLLSFGFVDGFSLPLLASAGLMTGISILWSGTRQRLWSLYFKTFILYVIGQTLTRLGLGAEYFLSNDYHALLQYSFSLLGTVLFVTGTWLIYEWYLLLWKEHPAPVLSGFIEKLKRPRQFFWDVLALTLALFMVISLYLWPKGGGAFLFEYQMLYPGMLFKSLLGMIFYDCLRFVLILILGMGVDHVLFCKGPFAEFLKRNQSIFFLLGAAFYCGTGAAVLDIFLFRS